MLGMVGTVSAGPIISATSAVINSGGPGFGSITDTHDQSGLSVGYTSGVDDFDTYIGGNPLHTLIFARNEWASNRGLTSASVTYDLGSLNTIDAIGLWNEDLAGIGLLDLFGSEDGVDFSTLAVGLDPIDNNSFGDYGAQVFSFAATDLQFIRFDMSECPQTPGGFIGCAIGEVAFRSSDATATLVPEPGTLGMLGLALAGMGCAFRRKVA